MSDYTCVAIKQTKDPNKQMKTSRFSWLDFGLQTSYNTFMDPRLRTLP